MNLHQINNYSTQEIIFSSEECNTMLKYMTELQQTVYSVRINDEYTEVGCNLKSQDLEYTKETKWIFDRVKKFVSKNIQCRWIGEPHAVFRNYTQRDFFIKHTDRVDNPNADKRHLTVSVQLSASSEYEGGTIVIHGTTEISKVRGNTALWGTDVVHEVIQLEAGSRNALVFFISDKHIEAIKTNLL